MRILNTSVCPSGVRSWPPVRLWGGLAALFALVILTPVGLGVCSCTMFMLSAVCLVVATAAGVGNAALGALTVEREKKTLDSLRLTQLTSVEVMLGKLKPELMRLADIMACLSPTVVAAGLLAGEALPRIFGTLLIALVGGVFSSTAALLVSSLSASTSQAVVSGWIARGVWLLLTPVLDVVAGAVFVQSSAPPVFTSVNPLAAVLSLDIPEATSGLRQWLPLIYLVVTPLASAAFFRLATRRFDGGLAHDGGLRDKQIHGAWRGGQARTWLTRALPGLAENPSFLRELVAQMRAGAGRWPGYLVFVVLFLAPSFYARCWSLEDLRRVQTKASALAVPVTTASLPLPTSVDGSPRPGGTLALQVVPKGCSEAESVVVVEGHRGFGCLRLALFEHLGIPMPTEALRFYRLDDPITRSARTAGLPVPKAQLPTSPSSAAMQALGIDTDSTSQAPRSAPGRDGRDATLHVGLAGAIGLLLLYLSIRFSAFLATAVTGERSRRTWEDLALTGISAGDAMAGKVLGSVVLPLTQMTVVFPVLLVFFFSGALGIFEIVALYLYAVTLSLAAAMLGLWASATSPSSHIAHLKALCIVVGAFFFVPPVLVAAGAPLGCLLICVAVAGAGSRRPALTQALFGLGVGLWCAPEGASPLTASISFVQSLTHADGVLRMLGTAPRDAADALASFAGSIVLMLSLASLFWYAALERLTGRDSQAIVAEDAIASDSAA